VARVPRSARKALEQVQGHGLVAGAKVEAAAFVTHLVLRELGALSIEEALVAGQAPHAAARAKVIVDNFTMVGAATVARMG
jgi:hypothetical protein